jgi:HEAT repeat protein
LYQELLNLGDEGLGLVTEGVQPNGKVEGLPSRYAVSLLTHYATSKDEKARIERIYLAALSKSSDAEVKDYFIKNLQVIGSNESVKSLAAYIKDKDLFDPAVSALVSIGTPDAKQSLLDALASQPSATQIKLIKALGRFRYQPALESITKFATGDNPLLKKTALWSIALIADAGSYDVLLQQAKSAGFRNDPTEATNALVEYMHQMASKGNPALLKQISQAFLDNTLSRAATFPL